MLTEEMKAKVKILQHRGLILKFIKEELFLADDTARSYVTIMQKILSQPLYTFNNRQSAAIRVIGIFKEFITHAKKNNLVTDEEYELLFRQYTQMKFNRDMLPTK